MIKAGGKMNLQLYVLDLDVAHFGGGLLEQSQPTFTSQRLFSALFIEALKWGRADEFLDLAQSDSFHLSNAFFYYYGFYLPKPIGYPYKEILPQWSDIDKNIEQTKQIKTIDYLHHYDFDSFVKGEAENLKELIDEKNSFYTTESLTQVNVKQDPYRVGAIYYADEVSLAVIATKDEFVLSLFESLQYSGIGGKRTSGMGRFTLSTEELEEDFLKRVTTNTEHPVMLLNDSLPNSEELEQALIGSHYELKRSSGFAYSESIDRYYRKQDIYEFSAGSTFKRTFNGKIIDAAPDDFPHPVWHYARPLFYQLEVD